MYRIESQESKYFLEAMINYNMISSELKSDIANQDMEFFYHYTNKNYYVGCISTMHDKYFKKNFDEIRKNDWELHKQLIKEGHNPNEIAKIIRKDEIGKLQELSSQANFDFNQIIGRSVYERHSFINQKNVTLIDYAAFFSSVKCFKYLLMNGAEVENTGKYAVAGGNLEIIHLCEQNHSSFEGAYEAAIKFHRNDIFEYIYENKLEKIDKFEKLGKICVQNDNFEVFSFLVKQGMKTHEFHDYNLLSIFEDHYSITNWCIHLMGEKTIYKFNFDDKEKTYLLNDLKVFDFLLNMDMIKINSTYIIDYFYKDVSTSYLGLAIKSGNINLMKYLLQKDNIDIQLGEVTTEDMPTNTEPEIETKKSLTLAIEKKNLEMVKLLVENDYFKFDDGVAIETSYGKSMSYTQCCERASANEILNYLNQVKGAKMRIEEENNEEDY